MSPFLFSGPAGESNPDLLVASQASFRWTSSPFFFESLREDKRSVRDFNPAFLLTEEVCRQKHLQTNQQSDPGWS